MTLEPINVITYPDYDHNSDLKVVLVADTPLIPQILELLDQQPCRVSIHCITNEDTDMAWIANTVNQSDFVYVSNTSKINRLIIGWILGRPNVWHGLDNGCEINNKYSTDILLALVEFLDTRRINEQN